MYYVIKFILKIVLLIILFIVCILAGILELILFCSLKRIKKQIKDGLVIYHTKESMYSRIKVAEGKNVIDWLIDKSEKYVLGTFINIVIFK